MKVGIITFHSVHNFGAVLQAYGLQEYLKGLGHQVCILDYRPSYLVEYYKPFSLSRIPKGMLAKKVKFLLREFAAFPIRKKREIYFSRFVCKHLTLRKFKPSCSANDLDVLIFGSDQIWNPIICNGLDSIYLGEFPMAQNKRLIAYAASLGSLEHLDDNARKKILERLDGFYAISCREQELTDFIGDITGREIKTTLDPVLLAGKNVFERIATKIESDRPYLLIFTLSNNEKVESTANRIAKERNLDIVEIVSQQISFKNKSAKYAVPVSDFLGYIQNASFVVTTSFHGTALSVLFNKEFVCMADDAKTGKRIINLLQILGLDNRVFVDDKSFEERTIDYKVVMDKILLEKEKSVDFINKALMPK